MERLEFENFKPLLGEWAECLQELFETEQMYTLYQEFKELSSRRVKITPESKNLYKWLEVVPPSKLKVILIGMDSYPNMYKNRTLQATGIAFDCSNSPDGKCQPSLRSFHEGIANELGEEPVYEPNLSYLTEQGVMLTNRALNCKLLKSGSFLGKWDFFWSWVLINVITLHHKGVPIVFLGKDGAFLKRWVFELNNPIFILDHPSYSARMNTMWDTKGVFKKINILLQEDKKEIIQWIKPKV